MKLISVSVVLGKANKLYVSSIAQSIKPWHSDQCVLYSNGQPSRRGRKLPVPFSPVWQRMFEHV